MSLSVHVKDDMQ